MDDWRVFLLYVEHQAELSSTLTITGVLRTDLASPISCTAANSLETEKSAPFSLTVYCEYCVVFYPVTPPRQEVTCSD